MRAARLASVVFGDIRRSRTHFLLASIGIVVGIATFAFFLALGNGVRKVVLGKIFPLDQLEVVPKSMDVDLGPLRMGMGQDVINDDVVAKIKALPGVSEVYPKMRLTVASIARGGKSLIGANLRTELVADGIRPELVTEDIGQKFSFEDFDAEKEPGDPVQCKRDKDCPARMWCGRPAGTRIPTKRTRRNKADPPPPPLPPKVCRHYVPIIASEHVVELYNGALRRAHGFPKLNPESVLGFTFEITVGDSMVSASEKDEVLFDKGMLVGFSRKAIPLGITLPLGYIQRYNVSYQGPEAASTYHSVIVMVPTKDDVAAVAKGVDDLNLEVKDSGAEQAALLIAIFMMVFGLVSAIIVGIAAVNIMHVFFMLVYERQREIGIMRAVGASRGDIARIILGQAALLGLLAGLAGLALATGASELFDYLSASVVPDFPYKPTTYFEFTPLLIGGSLAFSVGFCILGAFLPARRAARMDPARILTAH